MFMILKIIFIFYTLPVIINSQASNLLDIVEKFDQRLDITFFGYTDIANQNNIKPCACPEDPISTLCQICAHSLYINLNKESGNPLQILKTEFFASNKISEKFEFIQFYDSLKYNSFNLIINVQNNNNQNVDIWQKESSNIYGNFFYEDTYGVNRRIKATYMLKLRPKDMFKPFRFFQLRIDSIKWKNYTLADSKCCKPIANESLCESSCDFFLKLNINDHFSIIYPNLTVINNEKYYSNIHILMKNDSIFIDKMNISVNFISNTAQSIIDTFILPPISVLPSTVYILPSIIGNYKNLILNMSYEFICDYYQSLNCMESCTDDSGTNICLPKIETKVCTNKASDPPNCLDTNNCSYIDCKNGGKCVGNNDAFTCICATGYYGTFCEKFYCEMNCNNNGDCIAPDKCLCKIPYIGDHCDIAPCNESIINPCYNQSTCLTKNGNISCSCPNNFTGIFCEIPVCTNRCLFGECSYIPEKNTTGCICKRQYKGEECDVYIGALNFNNKKKSIIIALACIAAMVVLLIISFFPLNYLALRIKKRKVEKIRTTKMQNVPINEPKNKEESDTF